MIRQRIVLILLYLFLVWFIIPATVIAQDAVTGIELYPETVQIILGERDTIYAVVSPEEAENKEVIWVVSDPDILEVSEVYQADHSEYPVLEIKALAPGICFINATTIDGGFQAQAAVQVVVVQVLSITMIPGELAMAPAETFLIRARVEPVAGTIPLVTFESTNPAVASVNEVGMVIAKKPGETRIIARSVQDNSISSFAVVTVAVGLSAPTGDQSLGSDSEPVITGQEPVDSLDDDNQLGDIEEENQNGDEDQGELLLLLALGVVVLLAVLALLLFMKSRKQEAVISSSSRAPTPQAGSDGRQAVSPSVGIRGLTGYFAGQYIGLQHNRLTIGRDSSAGLVYPQANEKISRIHLTISYDPSTKLFTLVDSSSNGTFLSSHQQLTKGQPYQLHVGEKFYLVEQSEMYELKQ